MYQMYAYAKKYNAERVLLVYPYSDSISKQIIRYLSDDEVKVEVHFIDLRNPDMCLSDLVNEKLRLPQQA
jgi:5-methylcytosine-specific restriction enzyme subunit McrC